jgi:hypothetical protein
LAKAGADKTDTDIAIPPPLKALGGWFSAEWFLPSIVTDNEVVGLTLPDLPGRKRQSFRMVERSAAETQAGKRAKKVAISQQGPAARGILPVLEWIGATHFAAFRRTTLIFESKPVLYFATIPLANLKVRTANRLRHALMENHFRGCIVHTEAGLATAMLWPETEIEITGFIADAAPPHALHIEFEEAAEQYRAQEQERRFSLTRRAPPPPPPGSAKRLGERERRQMQAEKQALLQEIQSLRAQIGRMGESQSELGAMEALGLDDARLKSMLRLLHPDKHGNSEAANDAAKWLNNLRDLLKTKRA